MNSEALKSRAKEAIRGSLGSLIIIMIVASLIATMSNCIPLVGALLVIGPLAVGRTYVYYHNSRGQSIEIGDMFWGFSKCFGESFLAGFLQGIFISLWSCLCLVPGIIKAYSYSMTYYIMMREPGISSTDAITKSRELMNGNKMNLFLLQLSFIGWILLGIVTCGLAFLYVSPYMEAAQTEFFNAIYDGSAGRPIDVMPKDPGFQPGPNGYNGNDFYGNTSYPAGNPVNNYVPQGLPDNQYNPNGNGQNPNQYNPNGYGQNPNQYNPNGYDQNPNQYNPNGYGQNPNQYNPNGYGQNPNQYNSNGYGQNPNQYNPNGYGQDLNQYNSNGNDQNPNQYNPNGYDQNSNQ